MEAPNTGTMPPPSPPSSKNFACLLTLNSRCYQLEKSFTGKLLVAKASVGSLEIYTIGMLQECRTRRCTRVVGHGQPSSQHCHVPRRICTSSHGAEAAMLIIVDADVNALVGMEKKMRV